MKSLLFLAVLLTKWNVFATEEVRCVALVDAAAGFIQGVREVVLAASRIDVEHNGKYENRVLKLVLHVTTKRGSDQAVDSFQIQRRQSALEAVLNPSEFFISPKMMPLYQGAGRSLTFDDGEKVALEFPIFLDQREIRLSTEPWPTLSVPFYSGVHYLNFDAGMVGGHHRWQLYRLDFKNPESPTFTFVKSYTLVQGQVVNHKRD